MSDRGVRCDIRRDHEEGVQPDPRRRRRRLAGTPRYVVLARTTLMALAVASGLHGQELRSPALDSLRLRAEASDSADTETFWNAVAARSTPLIESLQGGDSVLVTFLWRGGPRTTNAVVFGALAGWLPPANVMERLPGTNVWYLSVPTRADVRFTYRLAENDNLRIYWSDPDFSRRVREFRPDPLNPDTVLLPGGRRGSAFVGPGFEPGVWTAARSPRAGRRERILLNERPVRLYVPPAAEGAEEVGLVVALDGAAYDSTVSTPATVESLTDDGAIPPVVVAMVEAVDRNTELPPNEGFVRFVADTLFPALGDRFPVSPDPARSVVVGSSLGGLAAAWLGYRLPHRFGNVVAQSGAYWWAPPGDDEGGWLPRLLAQETPRDVRLYLDAGILEAQPVRGGVSMLRLTQHLRNVLCAKGYGVAYRTFPGGHEYMHWRATLPGALVWTLGPGGGAGRSAIEGVVDGTTCRRLVPDAPGD